MKTQILNITIVLSILLVGMQSVSAQNPGKTTSKAALIDEVISSTLPSFPVSIHRKFYDQYAAKLPQFVMEQAEKAAVRDIDAMKISNEQKKSAKTKIPALMNQANAPIKRLIANRFAGIDKFLIQYFKESYSPLNVGEIIELNRFIVSEAGKSYLESVKNIGSNMNSSKPKPLEIKEKFQPQISSFLLSPVGKKFNDTFVMSPDLMLKKLEYLTAEVFKDLSTDAELTKIYEDFKKNAGN